MSDNGFHPSASGLLIPDSVERPRQVWTNDERRILDRATRLANSRGLALQLACVDCGIKHPLERVPTAHGFTLRCNHLDRVFVRGF